MSAEELRRQTTEQLSATERYGAQKASREAEIVDVTLPSGFVIKMEKPSKFTMLFRYGKLPQTAASGAVSKWIEDGIIKAGDIPEDQAKQINEGIKLRDRVLELSREPKLVVGEALNENELSTDYLTDEDATYLFAWVTAGGDTSVMLGNFPSRPSNGAVSGNGGAKRRKARK